MNIIQDNIKHQLIKRSRISLETIKRVWTITILILSLNANPAESAVINWININNEQDKFCYARAVVYNDIYIMMDNWEKNDKILNAIVKKYFEWKNMEDEILKMIEKVELNFSRMFINDYNKTLHFYFNRCSLEETIKDLQDK
ncbi:MAG: hypothetical protein ACD_4C00439G0007 [uncultured bacterium (gcode 4)]|uniref:Uncharacterized protein n=1 Tax=uncultured bacterium (gcode 4) TaxID=1234023 RepID=K2GS30_9BACT|nr:MAG: hypothetical protein ACD_4C00439G0007 [uncultured bacterium (gcode 4)]